MKNGIFFIIILILSTLFINGCDEKVTVSKQQKNEVVNTHGDISNIEALNTFIEQFNNHRNAIVKYVRFGIEGQRGVVTLSFEGKELEISHTVDGKFIEAFKCNSIKIEETNTKKKYVLSQCTGDFEGEYELLSVAKP